MTIEQLKALVEEKLNSRNLKSRVRFSALNKVIPFIKNQYGVDTSSLPASKDELKAACAINGAESSVINELYNQLTNVHSY